MTISIGINPITWSNDDLQLVGSNVSLDACLSDVAEVGFAGVELGHKFPRDATVLKPLLARYGIALVSGWYSGRLLVRDSKSEVAAMQAHAALLAAMDCDVLIFAEVTGCIHSDISTRLSQRPRIGSIGWRQFGQRLSEVGKAAAGLGLKLCYHHHMGTVVQTRDDIDTLMQETTDDVHLLLDTGHAWFAGADPVKLAEQYGDRIGHLHCKDIRDRQMRHCINRDSSFLDAMLDGVFTVPGDGCIDYPGVFAALQKVAYAGWAVVEAEQDPSVAPPLKFARLGYENTMRFSSS
ncbi:MAG: myo-inosose-2 dehydratase [Proteobacteria bacterium]|nr:myo-inosose-2 dehydratase [Pseudomonadota bacterium]